MQHGELRSYRGSRLVNEFFLRFPSFNLNDMTPSKQEIAHPTSSSSSFSSPTTASSDSETREREDQSPIDSSPVHVSSSNVDDRTVRPVVCRESSRASSEVLDWLQEFREILVDDEVPEHRDSHASSSHELSLQPTCTRSDDLGKNSIYTHFLKTEIAKSVRGLKLHVPRAEDAMAEPYLVQKFLVT